MRQKYKLLFWDNGTNRGQATDGSMYDGELITFEVRQADLSPEHEGYLAMGEVFSAYEDSAGDHHLYDILIEEGARAIAVPALHQQGGYSDEGGNFEADPKPKPSPLDGNIAPSIWALGQDPNTTEEPASVGAPSINYLTPYADLERRVKKLEDQINKIWGHVYGDNAQ